MYSDARRYYKSPHQRALAAQFWDILSDVRANEYCCYKVSLIKGLIYHKHAPGLNETRARWMIKTRELGVIRSHTFDQLMRFMDALEFSQSVVLTFVLDADIA